MQATTSISILDDSGPGKIAARDALDRIFRKKRLLMILLAIWTAGMVLYLWLSPPVYEDEVQFLINNNRAGAVVSPEFNNGPVPRDYVDETVVATELQLLSNQDLLHSVVAQCNLADTNSPADVEIGLKKLQRKLKTGSVLKADMIKASYAASDPHEVENVLRSLSSGYLDEHLRAHGAQGAYELFDQQARGYAQRLDELQMQLAAFQEQNSIVVLGQQKELNLRRLLDLEAARRENEAGLLANTKKVDHLKSQLHSLSPRITTQARTIPNQYSVERLNTMLVELQNKRTELLAKFQPQDRLVQEVEAQMSDTKAALGRANQMSSAEETTDVNPLRQSLDAELAKAELNDTEYRTRAASLVQETAAYHQALSGLQSATAGDDQLMREIKETEDNFFLYSKKREEARIEEAMDKQKIANVSLVKAARLPALPQPTVTVTAAATYSLGCVLILAFAFLAGGASARVHTPWELEALTSFPVLASVPLQVRGTNVRALLAEVMPETTVGPEVTL
jgi:uncharacterized protein involved in exopolysaccharide biosynthesis